VLACLVRPHAVSAHLPAAGRQQRFASIRLCGRFRRPLNGSLWRKAIAGRIILRP
jgi:hypothetical protein